MIYEKHLAEWLASNKHAVTAIFLTVMVIIILSPLITQLL